MKAAGVPGVRAVLPCVLVAAVLLAGCRAERDVRVLRLAHTLDTGHPVHKGMAHLAERLEALSGGTMRVIIYTGGQLGSERQTVELLQLGTLDMAKVAGSVVENFIPAMRVFSLPYLFNDQDHYWRVFQGDVGNEILLQGEPYWLRGLCYYDAGFRSFFTREKPIRSPADLNGMKIRVMQSNLAIQTINVMGGNATPMALGELYTAIQQGVVDGAEGNPPTMFASRYHEIMSYYSLDEHSAPPDVLVMGTHTWNDLDEQQRAWLMQAVDESVAYQRRVWNEDEAAALRAMETAGVHILRPDKRPFQDAVARLYTGLEGSDLAPWIRRIRALSGTGAAAPGS
jgi:tripartite ATP-independent transporter DctP family solute receptor